MKPPDFIHTILTDLKVELMDEFDMNFMRKGFFGDAWPQARRYNRMGSLMMRTGTLRRGMGAKVIDHIISFTNDMPYARIQNEGCAITVTRKMQKFFWAMYYSLAGRVTYSVKTRKAQNNQKNRMLGDEAAYWKALALKKVGSRITIPPRRFIGNHPHVVTIVKQVADSNFRKLDAYLKQTLKPR